jgi:hypothetical protein
MILGNKMKDYLLHITHRGVWIIGVLLMTLVASCEKSDPTDCFKNTGKDITEKRDVAFFDKIELNDNVNLVITQSDEYSISVRGGKNLLKKIKTEIVDGTLSISNNNSCNWMRSFDREITVYANVEVINTIDYRGSGDLSSSNALVSDSLLLNVWEGAGKVDLNIDVLRNIIYFHIGTADVYYRGKANLAYITASSFGPIHAEELDVGIIYMRSEGSNDCYVHPITRLEATIKNIGNIYYKGNPVVILNDEGSGELIKLE